MFTSEVIQVEAKNWFFFHSDFAEGFFAGLQVCFTGPSDNEMYMLGRAYWLSKCQLEA